MKRKVYDRLLEWKRDSQGKTALLVEGARRVGKSYIVNEFAKCEYAAQVVIDFSHCEVQVKNMFTDYATDLDALFSHLSLYYRTKFIERDTLFVFDEIQMFPSARELIKHLVADGRYDYIETGSLISIRKNVKGILIPSEEEHLKMYPMDFEEFLWAMGDDMLMPYITECFEAKKPMKEFHRRAMDYFRQYMIVGGMPQSVLAYVETKDFMKAEKQKKNILELYRADIQKYGGSQASRLTAIFDTIPAQLQRHEKKFKLSAVNQNARMRDYHSAFSWMSDSHVVLNCFGATEPNVGLSLKLDDTSIKCYMADTGLLVTQAFGDNESTSIEIFRKLMLDKLEVNKGMLVENIAAQMLAATGHRLFFYSHYSRESEDRMEIDFLVTNQQITNRHNIVPIEVKSGSGYNTASLVKFNKKFGQYLSTPIILHSSDVGERNGFLCLPLYMTPLL